jgi:glutathione synthase
MTREPSNATPSASTRASAAGPRGSVRIGFVMDPLPSLSLKKDSTLAMIRSAAQRGWEVFYIGQEDLVLQQDTPFAFIHRVRLLGRFAQTLDPADVDGPWYELGEGVLTPLGELDVVMMRKDPPFDMEYIYTTYFLERAEATGTLVVNRPASLRDCNEKFFATAFPQCCPPLVVSRRYDVLRAFHKTHGNVVFKRLDGMGGSSVFRIMEHDPNLGVVLETLTRGGREQIMAQLYCRKSPRATSASCSSTASRCRTRSRASPWPAKLAETWRPAAPVSVSRCRNGIAGSPHRSARSSCAAD